MNVTMKALKEFIGQNQLHMMFAGSCGEEGKFFDDKAEELGKLFETMPKTYEQDGKGDQAIAYLHYFHGGFDWYITERDMEEEQLQAFGLAVVHEAELGYISIRELIENGVELDLHWEPKTLAEIRK